MQKFFSIPDNVLQIGFFADVHSHLGNVLKMRKSHPEVKYWFCAGDVVDMSKALHDNNPILRLMNRFKIPSVIGNHDFSIKSRDLNRLDAEAKEYLLEMPLRIQIVFQDLRISIYHAAPTSRDYFISSRAEEKTFLSLFDRDEAEIFILGHTHQAYQKTFQGIQFINPGAIGIPEVDPSYCLLDREGRNQIVYLNDV